MVRWIFTGALAVGILTSTAAGQNAPIVRTGNIEVGGFAGTTLGGLTDVQDTVRAMGGGNVAFSLTRVIMPYVEYSYFPGLARGVNTTQGPCQIKFNYAIPVSDIHGGVHIRVPIRESRVIPYGVIGLGVLHSPSRTETVDAVCQVGTIRQQYDVQSANNFAANFGGGLRYYVNERFGLRVEAKVYTPTGTHSDVFGKIEGGFFFQIR